MSAWSWLWQSGEEEPVVVDWDGGAGDGQRKCQPRVGEDGEYMSSEAFGDVIVYSFEWRDVMKLA